MFFQETPADTFNFMVYGFAVILGSIALFIVSLARRFSSLRRDLQVLDELETGAGSDQA